MLSDVKPSKLSSEQKIFLIIICCSLPVTFVLYNIVISLHTNITIHYMISLTQGRAGLGGSYNNAPPPQNHIINIGLQSIIAIGIGCEVYLLTLVLRYLYNY